MTGTETGTEAATDSYLRRNGIPARFHQDAELRAAVERLLKHQRAPHSNADVTVEALEVTIIRRLRVLRSQSNGE